jgi:hypothetical protein
VITIIIKQSFTELKNILLSTIISNIDILKALVIYSEDFLSKTPSEEEQQKLDRPYEIIRKQIFPYKGVSLTTIEQKPYITMNFYNFRKKSNNFISGMIQFFIIIPEQLEPTYEGSRYDFIADKIEEILSDTGIGVFEFQGRGDIDIKDGFLGHTVSFEITDFYIRT